MTKPLALAASLLAAACLLPAAPASADAFVEVIDVGVPTDGTLEMTGYRGFVLRAVSDDGAPITRIRVGDVDPGLTGQITGALAQRWIAPINDGNYVQTSPGPIDARNDAPSDLNFDTHFLPVPGGVWTDRTEVGPNSTTDGNPIPSTPEFGYLISPLPPGPLPFVIPDAGGVLNGILDVPASAGLTQIDFAYVVTNSAFLYGTPITTTSGGFGAGGAVIIPEPGTGFLAALLAAAGLARPRRRRNPAEVNFESLEPRRLLASVVPVDAVATGDDVEIRWGETSNNDWTIYR